MILDKKLYEKFEMDFIKKDKMSIEDKYKILDAMYDEAVALGVFHLTNPLEGIEVKIKLAKIINSVPKFSKKNIERAHKK